MASEDILLFGLGGVGAVYAYILSRAQNVRVTVAARSNYKIVKEQGLEIQSEKYGNTSGYKFHNGELAVHLEPEVAGLPLPRTGPIDASPPCPALHSRGLRG